MSNGKIIITGPGASGKDTLINRFINIGFKRAIYHTTRPKREGEIEGETYFYINDAQFHQLDSINFFKEIQIYNSWYYAISNIQYNSSNIFIMTPASIKKLSKKERKEFFIIYLDIPYDIRKERLLQRNDADDVDRRLKTDKEDFINFKDFDLKIIDQNF